MSFSKFIYINNNDNSCRFLLGTKGKKPLICVGVNPSTATPQKLDTTISKVERFAADNGFDSWVMLNLYPQRATDPNELDTIMNNSILEENIKCIDEFFSRNKKAEIWAAWGNLVSTRDYLFDCLKKINNLANENACKWVQFGDSTKNGHPRHPSRLAYKNKKVFFDMHLYLEQEKSLWNDNDKVTQS